MITENESYFLPPSQCLILKLWVPATRWELGIHISHLMSFPQNSPMLHSTDCEMKSNGTLCITEVW